MAISSGVRALLATVLWSCAEAGLRGARPKAAHWAVTFEGNGYLAETDYAGVVAGLLGVLEAEQNSSNLSQLFHVFESFSSNSGGSWYAGMLAYSSHFRSTQEAMGKRPHDAGQLWNDNIYSYGYMKAFVDVYNKSWQEALKVMVIDSAGLQSNVTLGDLTAMQAWALGKVWLINVALPTGTADNPIQVDDEISYWLRKTTLPSTVPEYLPGVISLKLSSSTVAASAKLPFCGKMAGAACWNLKMEHSGGCMNSTEFAPDSVFAKPGNLLLSSALTASSAFNGWKIFGDHKSALQSKWAAWVQPGTIHPISSGEHAVLSPEGTHVCSTFALVDGAFTDNTGIAQAVAAGADVVTAFLNADKLEKYFVNLFWKGSQYQIFSEETASMLNKSAELRTIDNVTAGYAKITFAVVNLTTVRNAWFGIEAGRKVRLNLITTYGFLDGKYLKIWTTPGTKEFGRFAQTLVDAVTAPQHRSTLQWVLHNFFRIDI